MSDEFITLLCVNRQTDNIFYALVSKVIAYTHIGAHRKHTEKARVCIKKIETMQRHVYAWQRQQNKTKRNEQKKKKSATKLSNNGKILPKFGLWFTLRSVAIAIDVEKISTKNRFVHRVSNLG